MEEATQLIFQKEHIIEEQNRAILELKQELASADESYQHVSDEAESMKTDISTLVSRLSEAESALGGITAYQQKYEEAQDLLDKNKTKVNPLKVKLSAFAKERTENDTKIKDLNDSLNKTKRILLVTRQSRARSEQNLKEKAEEVTSLKDQLEKMGAQMADLKKEKVDAQNEKLKLSRKARMSAIKLKAMTDEFSRKEKSKTLEELEKRVNVLNKTVSGLAAQNSKLRGELAAFKLKKKATDEDAATQQMMARNSISRDRARSSMSREHPVKSRPSTGSRPKSLENQVTSLRKSLLQEKRDTTDSSSMLDRYQTRINALEQALQSADGRKSGDELHVNPNDELLKQQLSSLRNENKSLNKRICEIKVDGNAESQVRRLKEENDSLKKENERLSQVDHLDFFEEIEDLKYKYNEAVRQINQLTTG